MKKGRIAISLLSSVSALGYLAFFAGTPTYGETLDKERILSIISSAGYKSGSRTSPLSVLRGKSGGKGKTGEGGAFVVKSNAAPLPPPSKKGTGDIKQQKAPVYASGRLPMIPPAEVEIAERYALYFMDRNSGEIAGKIRRRFGKNEKMVFRNGRNKEGGNPTYSGHKILYYY